MGVISSDRQSEMAGRVLQETVIVAPTRDKQREDIGGFWIFEIFAKKPLGRWIFANKPLLELLHNNPYEQIDPCALGLVYAQALQVGNGLMGYTVGQAQQDALTMTMVIERASGPGPTRPRKFLNLEDLGELGLKKRAREQAQAKAHSKGPGGWRQRVL
ncbi:hypothetical protein ACLOJK_025836 [Asimina triloba]